MLIGGVGVSWGVRFWLYVVKLDGDREVFPLSRDCRAGVPCVCCDAACTLGGNVPPMSAYVTKQSKSKITGRDNKKKKLSKSQGEKKASARAD